MLLAVLVLCFSGSCLSVFAATPLTTTSTAATTLAAAAAAAAPPLSSAADAASDAAADSADVPVPIGDDDKDSDDAAAAAAAAAAAPPVTPAATPTAAAARGGSALTGPLAAAAAAATTAASAATASAASAASSAGSAASAATASAASAASSAGSAAGTAATSVLSDLANATANGAAGASLPFLSYSDPGPAVPFNLGQFLDIQRQNFITRVVDNLLRMSGDAAAQPVRADPGPLVDQPELRPPGQRWRPPSLPQPPPLSAEQRAAADAAGERYRAAADAAQAATTRTAARLGLPAENAPPALPGSTGAVPPPNPFGNITTVRRYNSSKARRSNFRRGATNLSSSSSSTLRFNNASSGTYYEQGLGAPFADAAAAASDVIDDAAPPGIATVPAVRK